VKTNGKALEDSIQMDWKLEATGGLKSTNLTELFQDRKQHFSQGEGLSKFRQLKK